MVLLKQCKRICCRGLAASCLSIFCPAPASPRCLMSSAPPHSALLHTGGFLAGKKAPGQHHEGSAPLGGPPPCQKLPKADVLLAFSSLRSLAARALSRAGQRWLELAPRQQHCWLEPPGGRVLWLGLVSFREAGLALAKRHPQRFREAGLALAKKWLARAAAC